MQVVAEIKKESAPWWRTCCARWQWQWYRRAGAVSHRKPLPLS